MSQQTPPPPTPPAPPAAPEPPPARVRPPLRRSRSDRKLGGVAGGLAHYFDIDPLLVRIGFVVLALTGAGVGLMLYIACLLLIPEEGDDRSEANYFVDRHGRTLAVVAGGVIALALLAASGSFGWGSDRGPWHLIVIVLVIAGIVILANDRRARLRADHGQMPPPTPYSASVTAPAAGYASQEPTAYATAPYATAPYATAPYAAAPYSATPYAAPAPPVIPPWEPRERSALGPLTVGAALITAGVLIGLDRGGAADIPAVVVLASTLAVVGGGLLLGGFVGRSRGLIALGVVLTVMTAFAGVVHLPGTNRTGDQTWTPATVAEVEPRYEWGAGEVELDLTAVSSPSTVSTSVDLGVGQVRVLLPTNAIVRVKAHVGAGEILLQQPNGEVVTTEGINRNVVTTIGPNTPASPTDRARPVTTFDLDLEVGLGQLEVSRA